MGNVHNGVAGIMAAGGTGANARLLAENIAELSLALVPWPRNVESAKPPKKSPARLWAPTPLGAQNDGRHVRKGPKRQGRSLDRDPLRSRRKICCEV